MTEWPNRWTRPQFKGPRVTTAERRKAKRAKRTTEERKNKAEVRSRDHQRTHRGCRFMLCHCHDYGYALHVAHLDHKGMGGNPKDDRSAPARMIQVCICRHRENRFSIDKGTIRCRPLTDEGTNGPVAWDINVDELIRQSGDRFADQVRGAGEWLELSRETEISNIAEQPEILVWLGGMEF